MKSSKLDAELDNVIVHYSHIGTMGLADITHQTVGSNRKAKELDGRYNGWETSVERG